MLTINELINQLQNVAKDIGGDSYVEAYGDPDSPGGAQLYFKRIVARPAKEDWENADWSTLIREAGGDMAIPLGDTKVVLADVSVSPIHL